MALGTISLRNMVSLLQSFHAMAFGLLSLILCSTAVPAVERPPGSVSEWESLWTDVLTENVDEFGRIDFVAVARNRTKLDQVVAFIAANDPTSQPGTFPSREAKLAYYINAYNALAMYGIVDAGIPSSLGGLNKITFFWWRTFKIGGRSLSLYKFENDVIRPLGEPRIHFALNCMVVDCPRLPRDAFSAGRLERQLDAATRTFVNESRNVRVDLEKQDVWLSSIFKFYTEDFLAHEPSLIAYINRYRTTKLPIDSTVQFQDYNWTLNSRSSADRK